MRLVALVATVSAASPLRAQAQPPVRAEILVEASRVVPGETVRVGVQFILAPGWHIYWQNPGDAGLATEISLHSGDATFGAVTYPPPRTFHESDGTTTYGYVEQALLVAPMQVQDSVQGVLTLTAQGRYLACNVTCTPGQLALSRSLEVGSEHLPAGPVVAAAFAALDHAQAAPPEAPTANGYWLRLLEVLAAAFLGGVLLNAMPCVLPVLALKAASLSQLKDDAKKARRHGWAYLLGVVGSMQVLAAAVLLARAFGQQLGWGFQMQQPMFVAGVAVALVLFAANCLGAFELTPDVNALADAQGRAQGPWRSVLEGVLAVLVATPCSAPFLGTAVAFALGQHGSVVLATFAAVGAGLAAPYLLLATSAASRRLLPRPGRWMLAVKVGLGYALLATATWLCWILGRSRGPDAMAALLLWALCAALGAQVLGAVLQRLPAHGFKGLACLVALLTAVGGQLYPLLTEEPAAPSQAATSRPYSEEAVREALAAKRAVFVDFTADWCVTCQYNERNVLADPRLLRAFAQHNVVLLRADWTRKDDAILRLLQAHGRAGVPMYLLYLPGRTDPVLLPEVLTVAKVLQSLGQP